MYPISAAFTRAITGDHEITTRVRSQFQSGSDAEPVDISAYFEGGSLQVGRQEIRRSGTIVFVDRDGTMVPLSADAALAPFGQELLIETGLVYPDDTEELIPQGVFRITKVTTRYPTIICELHDRAWVVAGGLLEVPLTIPSGTLYTTAIRQLVTTAYPDIDLEAVDVSYFTPTIVIDAFADPWAEAQKMATAIGYELYFDRLGVCQLRAERDYGVDEAVLSYSDASLEFIPRADEHWFNLATYDQELEWDTDDVVNAVIATGENTDNATPFRAVAYDTDPTSPTRYLGPFKKRPASWSSPLITSLGMAASAAQTELQKRAGISEGLRIPAIPHPALDVGDPILVVRRELGINQLHVVDAFDVPLRATGTHTIATRRRRVVLSGG
jgi:hypothetical protein